MTVGFVRNRTALWWITQKEQQCKGQNKPGHTEHLETASPPSPLRDIGGEEASGNRACIDTGLVDRHGTRAGLRPVVARDQRYRCGKVKSLTQAGQTTQQYQN